FKDHLLFCTQVQALKMAPLAEIPYMQAVTVLAAEQQFRIHAVLHHVRCSPLARDGNVMSQVPGEIVAKVLGTAIDLPSTERLEVVVIQGEDSPRTIAARRAKSAQVDAVGPAVNGVRAAVTGPLLYVLWLDHFYNLWLLGIVLGVDYMDARRAKTGNNQIPTFDVRMRSIGTQRGTARVPAEMMKFVSPIRHIYAAHDLPVLVRPAVYIYNEQSIRMIATVGIQSGHIRQPLYGRLHGKLGRGIERWISLPGHGIIFQEFVNAANCFESGRELFWFFRENVIGRQPFVKAQIRHGLRESWTNAAQQYCHSPGLHLMQG